MRYEYKIIVNEIPGNTGGYGPLKAKCLTIHHTAVLTQQPYNILQRLAVFTKYHDGKLPYHFYIPYDDGQDPYIYVTNWLNQFLIHCSNWEGNRSCLSCVLEGNFEVQTPTKTQLAKLKQLLDDLSNDTLENDLGYIDTFRAVNPKDNKTLYTFSNVQVYNLHYHNEIAEKGHKTACCGKNLIPYIIEYREKAGNVTWGSIPEHSTQQTQSSISFQDIEKTEYVALSSVDLVEITTGKILKQFKEGDIFIIARIAEKEGKRYAITEYSAQRNILNGLDLNLLIKKTDMEQLQAQITKLQEEINQSKNRISELEQEKTQLSNRIPELEREKTQLNEKVTELLQEKTVLSNRILELEQEKSQINARVIELERENNEMVDKLTEIKNQLKQKNVILSIQTDDIVKLQKQVEQKDIALKDLEVKYKQLQEEKRKLETGEKQKDQKGGKIKEEESFLTQVIIDLSHEFINKWKSQGVIFTRIMPYLLALIPTTITFLEQQIIQNALMTFGISSLTIIKILEAISYIATQYSSNEEEKNKKVIKE